MKTYLNDNGILLMGMIHGATNTIATESKTEEEMEDNIRKVTTLAVKLGVIKGNHGSTSNVVVSNAIRNLIAAVKMETE